MSPGAAQTVVFWIFALGIVLGALFTMTRRNPVAAVMSLVGTFLALAGLFATLSAHFLAVLQVLVYAGAIMVLFTFVVMVMNREEVRPVPLGLGFLPRILGVGAGAYLLAKLSVLAQSPRSGLPAPAAVGPTYGTVGAVGDVLFRDFLFPFEAVSLLLLVAVVGGLVVSRSSKQEAAAEAAFESLAAVHRRSAAEPSPPEEPGARP